MQKPKTLQETYDSCLADGYLKTSQDVDTEKITSLLENASIHLTTADIVRKALNKNSKEWMNVFTLHYDALRTYAEALLLFENVKSNNHQCLFAALCFKFPQLELDWTFFESVRTKRNGVNYYGERITYADWQAVEIQMRLYVSTLKKKVEERLRE
jgi:uncharacterized protein (UPF0332 family)